MKVGKSKTSTPLSPYLKSSMNILLLLICSHSNTYNWYFRKLTIKLVYLLSNCVSYTTKTIYEIMIDMKIWRMRIRLEG